MKRYLPLVIVILFVINQLIHVTACATESAKNYYFFNCTKLSGVLGHMIRFQSIDRHHLESSEAKISLINNNGSIVKQKRTTRNYMTINVKGYPKGDYTLMVELKEGSSKLKVKL